MQERTRKLLEGAGLAGLLVAVTVLSVMSLAYASEPKSAVIFLLDKACKMRDDYSERFTQAWVVCVNERLWVLAQAQLYGFEKYWHVVYVTQDNQHPDAPAVKGEAWFRDGENYAYSINNPTAIAHELAHLTEKHHFTLDGQHDYECAMYPQLWEQERGDDVCGWGK